MARSGSAERVPAGALALHEADGPDDDAGGGDGRDDAVGRGRCRGEVVRGVPDSHDKDAAAGRVVKRGQYERAGGETDEEAEDERAEVLIAGEDAGLEPRQRVPSPARRFPEHVDGNCHRESPGTCRGAAVADELLGGRHIAGHHEGGEPEPEKAERRREQQAASAARAATEPSRPANVARPLAPP